MIRQCMDIQASAKPYRLSSETTGGHKCIEISLTMFRDVQTVNTTRLTIALQEHLSDPYILKPKAMLFETIALDFITKLTSFTGI
jgi:hypothetical protein